MARKAQTIDVERLKRYWNWLPVAIIAQRLNHSRGTIYRKAKKIGLTLPNNRP
jgi:transcriptional antiterminator